MQKQKLTDTQTKVKKKIVNKKVNYANLGVYDGLHVCTCYTAQQILPENKFKFSF